MTTDDEYFERGINLRHGHLTEYYRRRKVRRQDPSGPEEVGVLLEQMTVAQKAVTQAYEIQRRQSHPRGPSSRVKPEGPLRHPTFVIRERVRGGRRGVQTFEVVTMRRILRAAVFNVGGVAAALFITGCSTEMPTAP